jgi:hypothetical protein
MPQKGKSSLKFGTVFCQFITLAKKKEEEGKKKKQHINHENLHTYILISCIVIESTSACIL